MRRCCSNRCPDSGAAEVHNSICSCTASALNTCRGLIAYDISTVDGHQRDTVGPFVPSKTKTSTRLGQRMSQRCMSLRVCAGLLQPGASQAPAGRVQALLLVVLIFGKHGGRPGARFEVPCNCLCRPWRPGHSTLPPRSTGGDTETGVHCAKALTQAVPDLWPRHSGVCRAGLPPRWRQRRRSAGCQLSGAWLRSWRRGSGAGGKPPSDSSWPKSARPSRCGCATLEAPACDKIAGVMFIHVHHRVWAAGGISPASCNQAPADLPLPVKCACCQAQQSKIPHRQNSFTFLAEQSNESHDSMQSGCMPPMPHMPVHASQGVQGGRLRVPRLSVFLHAHRGGAVGEGRGGGAPRSGGRRRRRDARQRRVGFRLQRRRGRAWAAVPLQQLRVPPKVWRPRAQACQRGNDVGTPSNSPQTSASYSTFVYS